MQETLYSLNEAAFEFAKEIVNNSEFLDMVNSCDNFRADLVYAFQCGAIWGQENLNWKDVSYYNPPKSNHLIVYLCYDGDNGFESSYITSVFYDPEIHKNINGRIYLDETIYFTYFLENVNSPYIISNPITKYIELVSSKDSITTDEKSITNKFVSQDSADYAFKVWQTAEKDEQGLAKFSFSDIENAYVKGYKARRNEQSPITSMISVEVALPQDDRPVILLTNFGRITIASLLRGSKGEEFWATTFLKGEIPIYWIHLPQFNFRKHERSKS
jgi:hypothetical protein